MNSDLQEIIRQADLLIKKGQYKDAWRLLLLYQNAPAARKRLVWLKHRQVGKERQKVARPRPRYQLYALIGAVVVLILGAVAIVALSQQGNAVPTGGAEPSQAAAIPTRIVLATLPPTVIPPTEIPPTENSQEVSLQQQLRDWLAGVKGVKQVLSFDVDLPENEAPLAYVEVNVEAGYNDTQIPDQIAQKLNGVLNTSQYSDFTVIVNDASSTVQYTLDAAKTSWDQVVLSSTVPPEN